MAVLRRRRTPPSLPPCSATTPLDPAAVSDRIAAERTRRVADMARKPKKASKLVDAVGAEVLASGQQTVTALVADGAVL